LRTGGAETGAAHQMCDQCHVVCTHIISLSLLSVLMPMQGAIGFRFGAGEVGKASLARIIRDVSPFVQVSVQAYMASTYSPTCPTRPYRNVRYHRRRSSCWDYGPSRSCTSRRRAAPTTPVTTAGPVP